MALSTVLAKALFDNAAESADELAFRKGDILMVLEQGEAGGAGGGWWLCSLHGRQGIAPGNRLRLLHTQPCPPSPSPSSLSLPSSCAPPSGADADSVYLSPAAHPRPPEPERGSGSGGGPELESPVYLSPPAPGRLSHGGPLKQNCAPERGLLDRVKGVRGREAGGEGVYQSPAGGRPRSRSGSCPRPQPHTPADWDPSPGRTRSPSLGLRGERSPRPRHSPHPTATPTAQPPETLYQTPPAPQPSSALHTEAVYLVPGGPRAAPPQEAVYLAPPSLPRPALGSQPLTQSVYLVPLEAVAVGGCPEALYLVPRLPPTDPPLPDEVYQTPSAALGPDSVGGIVCSEGHTEPEGLYQTPPAAVGVAKRTPRTDRTQYSDIAAPSISATGQQPTPAVLPAPQPLPKPGHRTPVGTPPASRAKGVRAAGRGGEGRPLLGPGPCRGVSAVPGSPNFARKPPPPAPPVRGVPKTEGREERGGRGERGTGGGGERRMGEPGPSADRGEREEKNGARTPEKEEVEKRKKKNQKRMTKKKEEEGDPDDENLNSQVYDTPPSGKWQRAVPTATSEDTPDGIYNIPRIVAPGNAERQPPSDLEVYDVPTLSLSGELQEETYSVPVPLGGALCAPGVGVGEEEDVYSVPSLPGGSGAEGGAEGGSGGSQGDGGEQGECGVYDMPALTLSDAPPLPRPPSLCSTGSGDSQWKPSLSALIQSALIAVSQSPPPPARELVASLAEILAVWRAGQSASQDPYSAPPLHSQARSRLSDLGPALSGCGSTAPSDALLSLVRRALEDSASLLQSSTQPSGRPRLPSQDSLSRRPLPALPVAEVRPLSVPAPGGAGAGAGATLAVGLGSRKGSWIQERPLPPPPPASFPLPPPLPPLPPTTDGEIEMDDPASEYAGIGSLGVSTAVPPSTGESEGYVKLQGKPDPSPPVIQTDSAPPQTEPPTTENRASPSPPLPVSLSLEDSELLSFYSSQSLSHLSSLADAIDALFSSVRGNQPPRVFVSRGKSLIVTAHKLVFIGDTLSRLLASPDLRAKVTASGGRLCQALKAVVVATKGAAQAYPSVPATQEMVDRVAELSQHAAGFSGLLQRLAEIS
ncbi:embryonal Fyn-associated substrate [Amia ocellicauda]|uniref:embryonal Fyn-associated substrate n=1 Tax=Amia ocellicauda TaxID=2972642 RepID=UPI0034639DC1